MPFIGRTIYRDNYQGRLGDKDNDASKLIANAKYGTFRSPVSPEFPFMGDTTYQNTYKPFKTYKFGDGKKKNQVFINKNLIISLIFLNFFKNKKDFEQAPSYGGQFLSTNGKDFNEKGIRKCPAREVLNKMAQEGVISWTNN